MLFVTDPCELKPADVQRQARLVASKASRGSDGNGYRAPEEMPRQWHLWFVGGRELHSATFSRHDGLRVAEAALLDICRQPLSPEALLAGRRADSNFRARLWAFLN